MAETYFVDCNCGKQTPVELLEAGTPKTCPHCRGQVMVPDSDTLKKSSGDKYPRLRAIEKIELLLQNGEPPFGGSCHGCQSARADYKVPITFRGLAERVVTGDGIQPTTTGLALSTGTTEEYWRTSAVPLLLCSTCHENFDKERASSVTSRRIQGVILVILLMGLGFYNVELALVASPFWLGFALAWWHQIKSPRALEPYVVRWVNRIRWVPEAIAAEQECALIVGESQSAR